MEVISNPTGFNDRFLDVLDRMPKAEAVKHARSMLKLTIEMRDRYQVAMLEAKNIKQVETFTHLYVLDCNNVIKLKKLLLEIEAE